MADNDNKGTREERQAARAQRQADRAERRANRQQLQDDSTEQHKAQQFIQQYTTGHPAEGYDPNEAMQYFQMVKDEATPEEMRTAIQETLQNLAPEQKAKLAQLVEAEQSARSGGGQAMGLKIQRAPASTASGGGIDDLLGGLSTEVNRGSSSNDMLGGLLGSLLGGAAASGGAQGGATAQGGNDMLGSLLGSLMGGGGAPAGQQGQAGGNDMIGSLLGSLMGGSTANAAPAASGGNDMIGSLLGSLMSGGQGSAGAQNSADLSPLLKTILGGVAAYGMQQMMNNRGR